MESTNTETFNTRVKKEAADSITGRKKSDACLLGLLLSSAEDEQGGIYVQNDIKELCELSIRLICHAAEDENAAQMSVVRSRGRTPKYTAYIESANTVQRVMERLNLSCLNEDEIFSCADRLSEKNFGAFAAGLFFSFGNVSSPEKEYHLEFSFLSETLCSRIQELFTKRLYLQLKVTQRRGRSILYLKDSESIEDILTLIGATMCSLEVMNVKVLKDIRNRANRATNCDTANCERQNRSAARQIEAIKTIEVLGGGLSLLPDELQEVAVMRLKYPEYTLSELSEEFDPPISKSGVNHRLKRIEQLAAELNGSAAKKAIVQ